MAKTWRRRAAICSALVLMAVVPVPDSRAAAVVPVPVNLVKDINAVPVPSGLSELTAVGSSVFFAVSTPGLGTELWKSDGTAGGTELVKDINPGEEGSEPAGLVDVGGTLYFHADNGAEGVELWKSNGTTAGTVQVSDINPGAGSSYADGMTAFDSMVYFAADDGVHGSELWKTDGTDAGTDLVGEVNTQTTEYLTGSGVWNLTVLGSFVYFTATDGYNASGTYGEELWRSDGTTVALVKDIAPGIEPSGIADITVVDPVGPDGPTLFFQASDPSGARLWRSNGTGAGTVPVADVNLTGGPNPLTAVGSQLYFSAGEPELWTSDGTADGTHLVKDINPGSGGSFPERLIELGGKLLFFVPNAEDPELDDLWTSDGSVLGTTPVSGGGGMFSESQSAGRLPGAVLYEADVDGDQALDGAELWTTDGTTASLVKEIRPGPEGSLPHDFTPLGDDMYFVADDGVSGDALWKSDGTADGTVLVSNPSTETDRALPEEFVNLGGTLFFTAEDGLHGRDLWKSDGTEAGTELVMDFEAGVSRLTVVGDALFLTAEVPGGGSDLWKTDGTGPGMVRLTDAGVDAGTSELAAVGSTLFLTLDGEETGRELWTSDGTVEGTVLVKDIAPNTEFAYGSSSPRSLTDVGGTLYFTAWTAAAGRELWKSNGTEAGTSLVADINPAATPANHYNGGGPVGLTAVGGALYFNANDGTNGWQLYTSDGAGAERLTDVPGGMFANELTARGSLVVFTAADADHGTELWSTNGTAAGTAVFEDLNPGVDSAEPRDLTSMGATLYFTADDGSGVGRELFRNDGTTSTLVADINPSGDGSFDGSITAAGGLLIFAADDGVHGTEVWQSDGTADGTVLAMDIRTGSAGGIEYTFGGLVVGGQVFFIADDGIRGREVWRAVVDAAPPAVTVSFGAPNSHGWFTSATVAGTVTVDDSATGGVVVGISCTGATVGTITGINTASASAPITVSAQGQIPVTCTATDAAGNTGVAPGSANTATVKHDSVAPSVSVTAARAPADGQLATATATIFPATVGSQPVLVTGISSDGTSGVDSVEVNGVSAGIGDWSAPNVGLATGGNTLTATATDVAGNSSQAPVSVTLNLDLDGDRIANNIDTQPTTPSLSFTDVGLPGGKTSGTILDVPSGSTITIADDPLGVTATVTTGGPGDRVRVQIVGRPSSEKLTTGVYELTDPVWDTTLTVVTGGPAEIESPLNGTLVTITVHEGATVTFTETVDDQTGALTGLGVEPDPDNPAGTVQVNGVDVAATAELAFGSLSAKVSRSQTSFTLSGTFTPGPSSDHIQQPLTEQVSLTLGGYALVLPVGSFTRLTDGAYVFTGTVGGVKLAMQLKPSKRGSWEIKANGKPVSLTSPVTVAVRIGDDLGVKTVKIG
ncbi:MAG: hypothetical protein JJD92_03265 [Frankiaceae bacterium]|nr:hypothetical protein [Frankiaceae bacterium]